MRHQLLATAALAGDQHRTLGARHALDLLEDFLHQGALPDQLVEAIVVGECLGEPEVFPQQDRPFQRLRDRAQEVRLVERLEDEIVGAEPHRLDGPFDRPEGGHDDRGRGGRQLLHAAEQGHSVHLSHAQIRQEEIHAAFRQKGQGVLCPFAGQHLVAFALEELFQHPEVVLLIVHNQNRRHRHP